jgi:hypothetical protein
MKHLVMVCHGKFQLNVVNQEKRVDCGQFVIMAASTLSTGASCKSALKRPLQARQGSEN